MSKTRRVIITGAPGTGKSTLLKLLAEAGYPTHEEMARALIAEQQALDSDILPWKDHPKFGAILFERQRAQYEAVVERKTNFYDRGMLDNLGYLRRDGHRNLQLEEQALNYSYHPEVFLTPPWEEIYGNDAVRWEDLDLMQDIHRALAEIYTDFGYQVVLVPKSSPQDRFHFVLNHLSAFE